VKQAPWLLVRPGELAAGRAVKLEPAEARHATGALRLTPGREVLLTDGAGGVGFGVLTLARRGRAEVSVDRVDRVPAPVSGLTLAMAVLAGGAMDLVVQKAVELGVRRFVPVCCDRSQFGRERAVERTDHWTRLAMQALKQCRRAWAMEIEAPISMTDLVATTESNRGIVADADGDRVKTFEPISADPILLVGPEGGFSPEETSAIEAAEWPRICLGPHVLRAETAAIAGVAVITAGIADRSELHS
jgi:16S rRNA (uracil1498-N3)-methyltransferase